jgi:transposase InsO family protein
LRAHDLARQPASIQYGFAGRLRFFASLECELINRRSWKTKAEARLAIFTWIEAWYNPLRRHSGLGQRSPNKFERSLRIEKLNTDIIEADDLVQEGQNVR